MAFDILYPDESKEQVHRHSSIDQFEGFLSVWKKGGWAPIIFDQLDSITCDKIKSHPVALSWGNDSFIYPEGSCAYTSDTFIYTDKEGVETKLLPECFGKGGEFYQEYVRKNTFINFDGDDGGYSLGVHNQATLRVGLSYVKANQTLPPVE